jgi:alpha/beta superfamily hydrolase
MGKKIISFSLWGDKPRYCVGAVKNAKLAKEIYPEWIARFYIHKNVNEEIIKQVRNENAEVIIMEESEDWRAMMWRYLVVKDQEVDIFISRDADSRLDAREMRAVKEWESSDKIYHIMRDHPYHGFPILGGMFGSKKEGFKTIKNSIDIGKFENNYGTDYLFFEQILYPRIRNNSLVHDEFFEKKPFPTLRINYQFVGQIFNEHDQPNDTGRKAIIKYFENLK